MNVPKRIAERKIKLLESQLRMLQQYKTDADILIDEYNKEYSRDMSFLLSRFNKDEAEASPPAPENEKLSSGFVESFDFDPGDKEQSWRKKQDGTWEKESAPPNEEPEKIVSPEWAKKLFRKIALSTHPDRVESNDEKLRRIFIEANAAMEQGDFEKLIGFALEIGVQTDVHNDVSTIPMMEKRIKDLREEIESLETSPCWLWGESLGAIELRSRLALNYLKSRNIEPDLEQLKFSIKDMEVRFAD